VFCLFEEIGEKQPHQIITFTVEIYMLEYDTMFFAVFYVRCHCVVTEVGKSNTNKYRLTKPLKYKVTKSLEINSTT